MAYHNVLSHGDFYRRITDAGYDFSSCAENIAKGQRTEAEAVKSWMDSPGHRINILGDYRDVGFGKAKSASGELFWCVNFGNKA